MTTEQLYDIIKIQQDEINQLRHELNSLKEWSDLNDYWLREMIDALTESIDKLMGIVDDEDYESPEYKAYHYGEH